jgi:hypothetical protein
MIKIRAVFLASVCTSVLLTGCSSETSISFSADVKPILDKRCAECHLEGGKGAKASKFLVDSYANLMKGTQYGPVIVKGDPLSSSLYRMVSGKVDKAIQMPHSKEPLPSTEIATIENWISQGAQNN